VSRHRSVRTTAASSLRSQWLSARKEAAQQPALSLLTFELETNTKQQLLCFLPIDLPSSLSSVSGQSRPISYFGQRQQAERRPFRSPWPGGARGKQRGRETLDEARASCIKEWSVPRVRLASPCARQQLKASRRSGGCAGEQPMRQRHLNTGQLSLNARSADPANGKARSRSGRCNGGGCSRNSMI